MLVRTNLLGSSVMREAVESVRVRADWSRLEHARSAEPAVGGAARRPRGAAPQGHRTPPPLPSIKHTPSLSVQSTRELCECVLKGGVMSEGERERAQCREERRETRHAVSGRECVLCRRGVD
eukprot:1025849-Rhodomonas_salina.1